MSTSDGNTASAAAPVFSDSTFAEKLRGQLSAMFGLDTARLFDGADLREDLGLDSIDLIDLLAALGGELKAPELMPEDFLDCKTVGDLLERYSSIIASAGTGA